MGVPLPPPPPPSSPKIELVSKWYTKLKFKPSSEKIPEICPDSNLLAVPQFLHGSHILLELVLEQLVLSTQDPHPTLQLFHLNRRQLKELSHELVLKQLNLST
jgi:hypothetical protein